MHADYIYRNKSDTVRVRLFRRMSDADTGCAGWDADIFHEGGGYSNYTSDEAESPFPTRAQAKAKMEQRFGTLTPMGNIESVDAGW